MNVDFKFELGDEVSAKGNDKKGTIKIRKYEDSIVNGKLIPVIRYYVDFGLYTVNWYDEDKIQYANDQDFKVSPETDKFLRENLLKNEIDRHLALREFDTVAALTKELNELHNGKVTE